MVTDEVAKTVTVGFDADGCRDVQERGCVGLALCRKARSFIEVFMSGRETRYLAMADEFRHTSGLLWSEPPAGQPPVLVSIECFLGNFSWVDFGNVVEILLPVGV